MYPPSHVVVEQSWSVHWKCSQFAAEQHSFPAYQVFAQHTPGSSSHEPSQSVYASSQLVVEQSWSVHWKWSQFTAEQHSFSAYQVFAQHTPGSSSHEPLQSECPSSQLVVEQSWSVHRKCSQSAAVQQFFPAYQVVPSQHTPPVLATQAWSRISWQSVHSSATQAGSPSTSPQAS